MKFGVEIPNKSDALVARQLFSLQQRAARVFRAIVLNFPRPWNEWGWRCEAEAVNFVPNFFWQSRKCYLSRDKKHYGLANDLYMFPKGSCCVGFSKRNSDAEVRCWLEEEALRHTTRFAQWGLVVKHLSSHDCNESTFIAARTRFVATWTIRQIDTYQCSVRPPRQQSPTREEGGTCKGTGDNATGWRLPTNSFKYPK